MHRHRVATLGGLGNRDGILLQKMYKRVDRSCVELRVCLRLLLLQLFYRFVVLRLGFLFQELKIIYKAV